MRQLSASSLPFSTLFFSWNKNQYTATVTAEVPKVDTIALDGFLIFGGNSSNGVPSSVSSLSSMIGLGFIEQNKTTRALPYAIVHPNLRRVPRRSVVSRLWKRGPFVLLSLLQLLQPLPLYPATNPALQKELRMEMGKMQSCRQRLCFTPLDVFYHPFRLSVLPSPFRLPLIQFLFLLLFTMVAPRPRAKCCMVEVSLG